MSKLSLLIKVQRTLLITAAFCTALFSMPAVAFAHPHNSGVDENGDPYPDPSANAVPADEVEDDLVPIPPHIVSYYIHEKRMQAMLDTLKEEIQAEIKKGLCKSYSAYFGLSSHKFDFEPTAQWHLDKTIPAIKFDRLESLLRRHMRHPNCKGCRKAVEAENAKIGRKIALLNTHLSILKTFRMLAFNCPDYVVGEIGLIHALIDTSAKVNQLLELNNPKKSDVDEVVASHNLWLARLVNGIETGAKLLKFADILSKVLIVYGLARGIVTLAGGITLTSGGGGAALATLGGPAGTPMYVSLTGGASVSVSLSAAQTATIVQSLSAAGLSGAYAMSGGPGTGGGGDCNPADFQKLKPKMGKRFAEWLKKNGEEIHALKGGGHAAHRDFYYNKKTGEIFFAIKNNASHFEPTYFTVQEVFGWAL